MTYEECVKRKLIEAAQKLTRELYAEMRHDMIGARIYYEDREAGERWLRMKAQKWAEPMPLLEPPKGEENVEEQTT